MLSLVGTALLSGAGRGEAQAGQPGPNGPDATAILARAAARYEALQGFCAEFRQTIDVTLLRQTRESRGELCQAKPNGFEMRWDDPEGDRIVADGSDLWVYFPSTDEGQAFRTPIESSEGRFDLHREFLSDPGERYEATFLRTERIDGRDTYVLLLRPRAPSPYVETTLWIDTAESLIRRLEILEESESIRTLDLVGMRLNPQIPPERFRFDPPPGVQVITR
jgi:outer membrane lipoprotein carrier protein